MKKLISFILALVLIAPCLPSMAADAQQTANYDFVPGLLDAAGIEVRVADPGTVTKSEFLYVIMQAIGMGQGSTQPTGFDDVRADSYYNGALQSALSMKIVSSAQSFFPDNPVKLSEACKMAVSALGYDYMAVGLGGYPSGYLAAAGRIGLLDDVTAEYNLTANDAYVFWYNLIEADVNVIDGIALDPEVSHVYKTVKNTLYVYHDIYRVEGIVTADSFSGMYEAESRCDNGFVSIDDVLYRYDGLGGYAGKKVVAYIKEEGSVQQVIYMYEDQNRTLAFDGEDIDDITSDAVSYFQEDRIKNAKLSQRIAVMYNGVAVNDIPLADLVTDGATLTLTDTDIDGRYDIACVEAYQTVYVSGIDADEKMILGVNNEIVYVDGSDLRLSIEQNGYAVDFEKISPNDILTVYSSLDGMVKKIVITPYTSQEGSVTEVSADGKTIYIGGTPYTYSEYFANNYSQLLKLGATASFIITEDGRIQAAKAVSESGLSFGYLIAVGKSQGLDTTVPVKLLTSNGVIDVFTLAKKLRVNDKLVTCDALGKNIVGEDGFGVPQIIRYAANVEKEITAIDTFDGEYITLSGDENEYDNLVAFTTPTNFSTVGYVPATGMMHPYFKVTSTTPVFLIANPKDAGWDTLTEEKQYRIDTNNNYISTNKFIKSEYIFGYNVNDNGICGALVIITDGGSASGVTRESASGVVYSANHAMDVEGNEGLALTVYNSGKYTRYFVIDEQVLKDMPQASADASFADSGISAGDYIRFNYNSANIVTAISVDLDYNGKDSALTSPFVNHFGDSLTPYYYGIVYSKGDGLVSMVNENQFGSANPHDHTTRYSFVLPTTVTVYDTDSGKIYEANSSKIVPYLADSHNCDRILIKTYSGQVTAMVVYR